LMNQDTLKEISFKDTGSTEGKQSYELRKVLIVHSYDEDWSWDINTEKGIIDGFEDKGYILNMDYTLQTFYMDTKKTYVTPEQIEERAEQTIDIIEDFKPDIVFVNDDNALKYVAVPYSIDNPDKKLPFIFSGINTDPEKYDGIDSLEKPGHAVTGALERFPYYQAFSLAKRIFPNATKIVLFADHSSSSNFLVNAFNERYLEAINNSPLEVIDVVQMSTFQEWKESVEEYQNKTDFLGILTYHQLKDKEGNVTSPSEVVEWTINNSNLPEIGFLQFHAEDGFWSAVGISAYKTGKYIGRIGGDILNGKDPANISIIDPNLVDVVFNLARSKMLGIDIPADILGLATEIYQEIK